MRKVYAGAILFFVLTITLTAQETNFKIKTIDNSQVELKEPIFKRSRAGKFLGTVVRTVPCRNEISKCNL